ncbi:hypothetical protein GQ54DRAFT_63479 [Martensiomyces pterosporus]|nr:hypothetical protein GQ54DRAFT_63479 [Martensiomyces pterosporus]
MQFFLDDGSIPIRLVPATSASRHRSTGQSLRSPSPPISQERAVPGYPYIRLSNEDDFDDSYPFDAFQDLRSAYGASSLNTLQSRMRYIQQQRAQAQLQRALLEQQLREQAQRESELREYQRRLEQERREQARRAAERAKRAYLSRLEDQEREKQLERQKAAAKAEKEAAQALSAKEEKEDAAFYPPFHFFNHILDSQIRSQDDLERKRAQKTALEHLLNTYFGLGRNAAEDEAGEDEGQAAAKKSRPTASPNPSKPAAKERAQNATAQTSPPSAAATAAAGVGKAQEDDAAARSLPPFQLRGPHIDPGVLENVLRVVHSRLGEIAADEEAEHERAGQDTDDTKIHVDVVEEPADSNDIKGGSKTRPSPAPAQSGGQKGVEIEEPVDYQRLAENLRDRVNKLDDDRILLPLSPLLSTGDGADWLGEPEQPPKKARAARAGVPGVAEPERSEALRDGGAAAATAPMDVDDNSETSDAEFSRMLDSCKRQLCDLQEASLKPNCEAARRRRSRNRRRRHSRRTHQHERVEQQAHEAETTSTEATAAEPPAPVETEEEKQKRAVHTIEDFILGIRSKRQALKVTESLRTLKTVEQDLDGVRKDYNRRLRNTQLSFVADKEGNLKLAHDRTNFTFHEYQEVLQKLLFKLDEIPSYGDEIVRYKRKAIVKKIQNTLDALDQFAADQESELSESSAYDGALGDESSNGEWVF